MDNRVKFTTIFFNLINKFPYCFNDFLRSSAKEYTSKSFIEEDLNQYKKISFLDGDFKWKAVNITIELTSNEVKSFQSWLDKNAPITIYEKNRDSDFFNDNFKNGDNYRSIGWIDINNHKNHSTFLKTNIPESVCEKCYVTIDKLENGFRFLSLYFFISVETTENIKQIDLSNLKNNVFFETLNPFSKRKNIINFNYVQTQAFIIIEKELKKTIDNVKNSAIKILNIWKLNKNIEDLKYICDFIYYSNSKYFSKEKINEYQKHAQNGHISYITPYEDFLLYNKNNNNNGHFCNLKYRRNKFLEYIYIECEEKQDQSEATNKRLFQNTACTTTNSHISYLLAFNTSDSYKMIHSKLNSVLHDNNLKIEEVHKTILESEYLIQRLEEKFRAIENRLSYNSTQYSPHMNEILKNQKSLLEEIKVSVGKRKVYTNDSIQIQNLKFHRRYSYIVGFLVVIQILIAGFQIYFSEKDFSLNNNSVIRPNPQYTSVN